MKYLSVCSGIEAASVAWHPLGWTPIAFSEIEKFPCAVLAHHYPDVPNLGDMTEMDVEPLGQIDILVGGTPCQAFSVAGLRQSLNDARGNLTLSYVRLIHELVADHGLRNAVWENVPGVLSTKDNAFGCFLGAIVGSDDPLLPPGGKRWPNAGMVSGPKGRAAWAIKDAQYFGLAQRRRRVFVVSDFGRGADPAAVLFELEGVRGNPAPSREAREDVAPTISARTKGGGGLGTDFDLDGGLIQAAFGGNDTSDPIEVATARNAHGGPHGRLDFESETFIAQTPIAFDTTQITSKLNRSSPKAGDPVHPLAAGAHPPAIVFNPKMGGHPTMGLGVNTDGTTYTLDAMGNSNAIAYAQTVALRGRDGGATAELGGEVATALRASQGGGDKPHVLTSAVRRLTPVECERLQGFPDNWTRIPMPQRGKKAGPVWAADGPRYKALGNSMAVPVMHWIGARIDRFMPREQVAPVAAKKTLRFTAGGRMVFE